MRITDILDADTAAILLLEPNGDMLRARAAKGLEEEVEQGLRLPVGKGFAGRIAAERRAIAIEDIDHADILNPLLREKGIRSLLGVPLLFAGEVLGVLHVGTLTDRHFSDDERELLQLAADRAAIAIEHARLFDEERSARRRLESVQRLTDATLAYLPQDDLLRELLLRVTEMLATDTAAILLLEPGGEALRARAAKGIEEEVEAGRPHPVRTRLRRSRRRGAPSDLHCRHRARRDPQPAPAGEGHPLAARGPAARRGSRHRRAPRRHAHAARVHARRGRAAPACRRPRRAGDRERPPVRGPARRRGPPATPAAPRAAEHRRAGGREPLPARGQQHPRR